MGRYNILIDGGKPEEENYKGFSQRIRTVDYMRNRQIGRIDLLIVTHLHEDHVGGLLDVVRNFEIGEMWCNYAYPEEFIGRKIAGASGYHEGAARLLNSLNIYNEICCALTKEGKTIREIKGVQLNCQIVDRLHADVFGPKDDAAKMQRELLDVIYTETDLDKVESALLNLDGFINDTSIVLRLLLGKNKILLCGDVYHDYWNEIIDRQIPLQADILKLPHHGQLNGVSQEFVQTVKPDFVVISTSNNRPDNCPNPEVLQLFERYGRTRTKGIEYFFTDAVNMPPYSSSESMHHAIKFLVNGEGNIEYEYD